MNRDLILSIDAGTQSVRAAIVDLRGAIRCMVKTPIEPYFSKSPGWAEQEPEYYWRMLCDTCNRLFAKAGKERDGLAGVAITTQRATVIDVDKNGEPLRPAMVWLDQRKADSKGSVPVIVKVLSAVINSKLAEEAVRDCEANWIRQNQPEIWEKTHKHLFLSGFFTHRLTGEFRDSCGNIVGYVPFDNKAQRWAKDGDLKWKLFRIEREKLPELVNPGEMLGSITAKAAAATGIPEGLPVIAAASDKACDILGSGCTGPEILCMSLGTTSTVNVQNSKYIELRTLWPPYPSAIPGQYYTEISVMRGAWMISWFKDEFGLQERLEAKEKGVSPEELLDRLVRDVPPGSMGLILQPYWTPTRDMAQYTRGSVIGFCDFHKRAHLYRSIIEGLIFALKEGALLSEKKNGARFTGLRVSGGGSQSDSIMQIAADVLGLPSQRPRTPETSTLGAAIDAAVGLKLHTDFSTAVIEMTGTGRTFEPIEANVKIYRELYERVYLKIHGRLLPLFRDLKDITGHPE